MEMIIVHNTLLRIINSIYLQCINVGVRGTQQDIDDFVQYARLWHKGVTHHHHTEETMIFPDIERMAGVPGLMEANVAQHEAFHDGMESYKTYLDRVSAGEEKYDGLKFKQIIDSFADVLHQHLTDEIDTLVKLHEEHADKADWGMWYKKTMEEILKATKDPEHAVSRRLGLRSASSCRRANVMNRQPLSPSSSRTTRRNLRMGFPQAGLRCLGSLC